ncbi:MAG: hypothetical protein SF053_04520 [Bacteroidia bacterium]|nr:hypothetical protein [Bacteroidia bacterium]
MSELLSQLPPHIRQQVADFIAFLLVKYPAPEVPAVTGSSYRERLMKVSVWEEADIKPIEEASVYFHQWNPEPW